MNSLNNDCLIEIVKILDLKDQISAHQVCSSLQVAVTNIWLAKYKQININFLVDSFTNEDFSIFLKTLQHSLQILQLKFLNKEKYEVLKKWYFPRVTEFRFTLDKPYFLEDGDLIDLRQVLPNLKAFSPQGNFTGLYIAEWPLLKELTLSFCLKLEMQWFQTILNRLKLEKLILDIFPNTNECEQMELEDAQLEELKYLKLNTYELYYILYKPLPSLKELVLTNRYNPRQLFDVLLSVWQAKDIHRLETANVDNILVNCIEMKMNVEQLSIINDGYPLPANVIHSIHKLTDLRKLRFTDCIFFIKDFFKLLKKIPQLQEISFESCHFDVANIVLNIAQICGNRKGKLRLNMFENRLIDNLDRPTLCTERPEQPVYVSVTVLGYSQRLELTQLEGGTLCTEPLRVVYR